MTDVRLFVENSLRRTETVTADGGTDVTLVRRRGGCLEETLAHDHVRHVPADGADILSVGPSLPAPVAGKARATLRARPFDLPDPAREALVAFARTTGTVLTWAGFHQRVLAGPVDAPEPGVRAVATVEVAGTAGGDSEVARWRIGADVATNLAAVRAGLPPDDPTPSRVELVLLPGRAGAFFHELVGHPMEADVVASGTSYLGARRGRRVAPDWLEVTDGAGPPETGFGPGPDDEGTPRGTTRLVAAGAVGDPVADVATALPAGAPPRGHGRRLDYTRPTIPRMTHTSAYATATGDLPRRRWIAPLGLSLETMSIATGEFHFTARTPVLHDATGPVARLPRMALRGSGAEVLAALRPAGGAARTYGRASRGCGKLGQFPLIVSFANSGLRLPPGVIEVTYVD